VNLRFSHLHHLLVRLGVFYFSRQWQKKNSSTNAQRSVRNPTFKYVDP